MPLPPHLALPPVKAKMVKLAAGCRCELCQGVFPLQALEIHLIRGEEIPPIEPADDLQRHILVLCPACHGDIHRFGVPVPEQREILRYRPRHIRSAIRKILHYRPPPYVPPGEDNLPEKYESVSHDHWGWGV